MNEHIITWLCYQGATTTGRERESFIALLDEIIKEQITYIADLRWETSSD